MAGFDRRELLKYFGIGATITPLVGGEPLLHAAARLIETPKIEIATALCVICEEAVRSCA